MSEKEKKQASKVKIGQNLVELFEGHLWVRYLSRNI